MTNEEAILRVLTEIRDAQREDLAYRRKIMEQSIRMQRSSFWWQRIALLIVVLAIAVGAYIALNGIGARHRPTDEPNNRGDIWEGGKR